jgi:hypothetical protein
MYESHKIDTMKNFLSISLPSTIASASDYIPQEYKSVGVGAGILFGIISAARSVKKERLELQNNPLSYLLNLRAEIETENPFVRLGSRIKGLIK